jgi:hypothetical protein
MGNWAGKHALKERLREDGIKNSQKTRIIYPRASCGRPY